MKIGFPKSLNAGETRLMVTPQTADKLTQMGAQVVLEHGMDSDLHPSDSWIKAGCKFNDRSSLLSGCDIICRIDRPSVAEIGQMAKNAINISFLDPFNERSLVESMASAGLTSISLEMIPRTTTAQKMDVLSSQASLAGYVAVIKAAQTLDQIFPMMMTPAGTINPSKVFIIGAGVAGLQAIATAKRMGAKVEAFDTRPVVEEQVKSLGGKFVKVDLGETGQTKGGYAKALTEEQLQKQREVMVKHCAKSDVVITTAQLFGRKAPLIITEEMVKSMAPGSLLIDLAASTGGNVAGSKPGEVVEVNGVKIIGADNFPAEVPVHATQMLAANVFYLLDEFWDDESKKIKLDLAKEIPAGCIITHEGSIVNKMIKDHYAK